MSQSNPARRITMTAAALIAGAGLSLPANAQSAAAPAPSPAKQAVEARKAVYTLIGSNFKPVGEVLRGRVQYDSAEVQKRAARIVFLAELASEAFPDASNSGLPATRAKPDIWKNRAEFDKRLKDFQDHAQALAEVSAREKSATDAFKTAAAAVAQDCKGCHDSFREE